jgi:hypothetical protein
LTNLSIYAILPASLAKDGFFSVTGKQKKVQDHICFLSH